MWKAINYQQQMYEELLELRCSDEAWPQLFIRNYKKYKSKLDIAIKAIYLDEKNSEAYLCLGNYKGNI